jgi:hypothetical protein
LTPAESDDAWSQNSSETSRVDRHVSAAFDGSDGLP